MWRGTGFSKLSILFAFMLAVLVVSPAFSQEQLQQCETLLEKARTEMADVLSPETYSTAMKAYNEAVKKTEKGESLDKIRKLLGDAINGANTAIRNSDLARVTFVDVLPAREKAQKANAPSLVQEAWKTADSRLYNAANALERGNANDAKKIGAEARDLFLTAELLAIKEAIIGETGRIIDGFEKDKVNEDAPQTFASARKNWLKADNLLDKDRYNKTEAESINKVALYEANHAKRIADRVRRIDKSKTNPEQIQIDLETSLMTVANKIGLSLRFDEGLESQVGLLAKELASLKSDRDNLSQELGDLRQKYEGTQEVSQSMKQQLEAQRIIKERIDRINALFGPEEAKILQEGNQVIIRLTGFSFPSGTATVEPQYFPLLTKVQRAISEFPSSRIAIEGNTDSMGGDRLNEQLSQKRADAIRSYLVANLGINPSYITAVGYGAKKPIANNETNEGRALNRRIDVVISP